MKLKVLFDERYRILAVTEGDGCPVEEFLAGDDRACAGLVAMLEVIAANGLDRVPAKWLHEANKEEKVLEFIKGNYRLLFFKGHGRDIAVCTGAIRKRGRKADPKAVTRAAKARAAYLEASEAGKLEVIDEDQ